MDLQQYITTEKQLDSARQLALKGLFCYQPFIFGDTLETGVGWEFENGEFSGLIYWPDCPDEHRNNSTFKRYLIKNDNVNEFRKANQILRQAYEGFIDSLCNVLGDISRISFVDVGTNAGYFPVNISKRGGKKVVGYDNINYSETFDYLNNLLGTYAEYRKGAYDPKQMAIPGCEQFDVAIAMHVICHLSDPLHFLSFLGSIANKAILLWNHVIEDTDELLISYGGANKYYKDRAFPFCFDYDTRMSRGLIFKCLELMGYTDIRVINPPIDQDFSKQFRGMLSVIALRP